MNKTYKYGLIKFKDPVHNRDFNDDLGWTGDVKYHESASRSVSNGKAVDMRIVLAPNPSHLESVNPVVQGMSRASGTIESERGGPVFDPTVSIPVQIHGDAAFMGQGINAETLNLSLLPGYYTGGTIHIITNNQLGFTTLPSDSRSTLYASDLAKGFEIPIVHVNADDAEACIETMRLAYSYIQIFKKDFLIDLVGYRKHGHNESDEAKFTQPLIYNKIDQHPSVREILAGKGEVTPIDLPHQVLARHGHVLGIGRAEVVVALVGAGTALDAGVEKNLQGARLAHQFTHLVDGDLLPVVDQLAGESDLLLVILLGDKRLAVSHRAFLEQGNDRVFF